jgi:hypothetical protein
MINNYSKSNKIDPFRKLFVSIPPEFFLEYEKIDGSSWKVLGYLFLHSYYKDDAFLPIKLTITEIASKCSYSVNTVKKALDLLKKLKLITYTFEKNQYTFNILKPSKIDSLEKENYQKLTGKLSEIDSSKKTNYQKLTGKPSEIDSLTPPKPAVTNAKSAPVIYNNISNITNNNISLVNFEDLFEDSQWSTFFNQSQKNEVTSLMKKYTEKRSDTLMLKSNKKTQSILKQCLSLAPPEDNFDGANDFRKEVFLLIINCIARSLQDDRINPLSAFVAELELRLAQGNFSKKVDFSKNEELLKEVFHDPVAEKKKRDERQKRQEEKWEQSKQQNRKEDSEREPMIAKFREVYPDEYGSILKQVENTASLSVNARKSDNKTGFELSEIEQKRQDSLSFTTQLLLGSKIRKYLQSKDIEISDFITKGN